MIPCGPGAQRVKGGYASLASALEAELPKGSVRLGCEVQEVTGEQGATPISIRYKCKDAIASSSGKGSAGKGREGQGRAREGHGNGTGRAREGHGKGRGGQSGAEWDRVGQSGAEWGRVGQSGAEWGRVGEGRVGEGREGARQRRGDRGGGKRSEGDGAPLNPLPTQLAQYQWKILKADTFEGGQKEILWTSSRVAIWASLMQ